MKPMPAFDASKLYDILSRFPRQGLISAPTPLEPLLNLSKYLGGPRIWIKREDHFGIGLGGNTIRKLDFLLPTAIQAGADTLISSGMAQSNSQRQVAAVAAKLGLECHLAIYRGRVKPLVKGYGSTGNALLNRLFGAVLHEVPWTEDRNNSIKTIADAVIRKGRKPHIIPYGASCALTAIGYASVILELAHQCSCQGISPRAIIHSSDSGGTQAGLIIGASLAMPQTDIFGVDVDANPERVRNDIVRLCVEATKLIGVHFQDSRVHVIAGYARSETGAPHKMALKALKLAARSEALILDPIYSANGMAGLISLIQAGRWDALDDVIFIHTGGAPTLFAYRSSLGF